MKQCTNNNYDCPPICDFCKYYLDSRRHCELHKKAMQPEDGCSDFYCYTIDNPLEVHIPVLSPDAGAGEV